MSNACHPPLLIHRTCILKAKRTSYHGLPDLQLRPIGLRGDGCAASAILWLPWLCTRWQVGRRPCWRRHLGEAGWPETSCGASGHCRTARTTSHHLHSNKTWPHTSSIVRTLDDSLKDPNLENGIRLSRRQQPSGTWLDHSLFRGNITFFLNQSTSRSPIAHNTSWNTSCTRH